MNHGEHMPRRIMPGIKPVLEMLRSSPHKILKILYKKNIGEWVKIAALAAANKILLQESSQTELDKLCMDSRHLVAHQGVLAFLKEAPALQLDEILAKTTNAPLPVLLALDQISDPGNMGTLARTAWALGAAGLLLPEHSSAKPGIAAMKSSAGALELLPCSKVSNLAKALDIAEEKGLYIYGTGIGGSNKPNTTNAFRMEWQLPAILVLGNEAKGIRPGVQKRCQTMIQIPFAREFDSLNIAQAGAILLGLCAARHCQ